MTRRAAAAFHLRLEAGFGPLSDDCEPVDTGGARGIVGQVIISDSFVIADWADPGTHPGRPIAGLHLHRSDDEAWVVLEGRLAFSVGVEEREVAAGDSLLVPHGTPHSYWNPVAEPARYLLVMTPRIHRLIEALHAGKRTDFAKIFEEHDSELLT